MQPGAMAKDRAVRWWGTGCAVLSLLPFVAVGAYVAWAYSNPRVPLDTRPRPNPNGFGACVAAVRKLGQGAETSLYADPRRSDPRVLKRLLQPDEPALDELRHAMRIPYMTPAATDSQQPLPYLRGFREAARRFRAESRVALAEGHAGEAAQDALDAIDFGSRVGRGGTLVHHLVGLALSAIGTAALEPCIGRLDPQEARAAGERLDRIITQFPTLAEALTGERFQSRLFLDQFFHGRLKPDQPGQKPMEGGWELMPKPLTYWAVEKDYRELLLEASKSYPQRRRVPDATGLLPSLLVPSLSPASVAFTKNDAVLRILRVELALQEYRQKAGHYPDTLAEFWPDTLKSPPIDPFSEQPFRYRRTATGYLLYSMGPDGVDDGGRVLYANKLKPESTGDLVAGKLFPPASK